MQTTQIFYSFSTSTCAPYFEKGFATHTGGQWAPSAKFRRPWLKPLVTPLSTLRKFCATAGLQSCIFLQYFAYGTGDGQCKPLL